MDKQKHSEKKINKSVAIKVNGSGTNVWAYAISDETYARITQDTDEEDPVDIIMGEYKAGQLVCWGIDVSAIDNITLDLGGKIKELKIIQTHEDYSLSEALKDNRMRNSSHFIECKEDTCEWLGDNFDLRNFNHVFLDSIEWKDIKLELSLPVSAIDFDRQKLSLLVCKIDSVTELCRLTYNQGLLAGLEEDIIGVIYDGKKYFFDSVCDRSFSENRYILSRSEDGWEINEEVEFW